jgi:uncharacterized protein YgiM (DUF1202 family)
MKRIVGIALFVFSLGAYAEQLFISDKLVVSVYAEANQESEKLATLESGDAIEVIEKNEGFAHVRLADGRDGWIKSSYLTAQAPAVVRLKELEKQHANANATVPPQVAEQLKQLQEQNTALHGEVDELKRSAAAARTKVAPEPKVTTKIVREDTLPAYAWQWGAALMIATGVVGFVLGYRSIANRIRRKYGNLRIY